MAVRKCRGDALFRSTPRSLLVPHSWKPLDYFNLIGGVTGFIDLFLAGFAFMCFWLIVTKRCCFK